MKIEPEINEKDYYWDSKYTMEEFLQNQDKILGSAGAYRRVYQIEAPDPESKDENTHAVVISAERYNYLDKLARQYDQQMIDMIKPELDQKDMDYQKVLKFLNYVDDMWETMEYQTFQMSEANQISEKMMFSINVRYWMWLFKHSTASQSNELTARIIVAEAKDENLAEAIPMSEEDRVKFSQKRSAFEKDPSQGWSND